MTEVLIFERRVFQEKRTVTDRVPCISVCPPLSIGSYRCGNVNRHTRDSGRTSDSYCFTPIPLRQHLSFNLASLAGQPASPSSPLALSHHPLVTRVRGGCDLFHEYFKVSSSAVNKQMDITDVV